MNRIITIGREFGSGGRELGRRLSERMNIAYYDSEITVSSLAAAQFTFSERNSHFAFLPMPTWIAN